MIKKILMFILLLVLALAGYKILKPESPTSNPSTDVAADTAISKQLPASFDNFDDIPPSYVDDDTNSASIVSTNTPPPVAVITAASTFSCDGRKHCSQMTSCAEATYFIQNCSNTKMDGNNDGIPCEKQWCK